MQRRRDSTQVLSTALHQVHRSRHSAAETRLDADWQKLPGTVIWVDRPVQRRWSVPIPEVMTASTEFFQDWTSRPAGKIVRGALAFLGLTFAVLLMMNAALVDSGSWALVLVAVALTATSVRAAQQMTMPRILAVGANILAVPAVLALF